MVQSVRGPVYLASALAGHTQKGIYLLFGIYGRDVQEVTNMEIPGDVKEKAVALCPCRYSCGYNEGEILSFNR